VAGAGRIAATTDGGRSWITQYSGPASLNQVDFTDAAHGWAVGQGVLLRTENGGATWTGLREPSLSGACQPVGSVHFVSPELGYAVAAPAAAGSASSGSASSGSGGTGSGGSGSGGGGSAGNSTGSSVSGTPGAQAPAGHLLRTTDGGATWSALTAAPSGVQSACFGSAQDGYAGASGRIWRTTDAGKSWALAFTEPDASSLGQPAGGTSTSAPGTATSTAAAGTPTAGAATPTTGAATSTAAAATSTAAAATSTAGAATSTAAAVAGQSSGDTPELQCAGQTAAWVLFLGSGVAMMHAPYLAYATTQGTSWRGVMEEPMLESALRPQVRLSAGPGSEPGPFSVISPSAAAFVGYTPPANGYGAAPVALVSEGTVKSAGDVGAINQPLGAAFLTPAQGWVVGENLKSDTFDVEATTNGGRTWTTQYTAT
jgi:photosystem II stability/assembly factor-like uncharacterized protein